MHTQLRDIVEEFRSAQARLHKLAESTPESQWHRRSDPERWSMAECVGHLNLTSEAFLPPVWAALAEGRRSGRTAPRRYRRDPIGWLLWRMVGPPVRYRMKTTAAFVPLSNLPLGRLLADFDRLQREQIEAVQDADGLDLGRLWVRSPFNPRIRYNAYSCLTILPRHQHRHLWQAEQVWSGQHASAVKETPAGQPG